MQDGISPLYEVINKNTTHLRLTAKELNYIHNTHQHHHNRYLPRVHDANACLITLIVKL
ncbi:MAG: hypothetical protein JSS50_01540 [Proteobacteria bacterium]|nr:hypothetical protein [Pseudomonadota bacterium]